MKYEMLIGIFTALFIWSCSGPEVIAPVMPLEAVQIDTVVETSADTIMLTERPEWLKIEYRVVNNGQHEIWIISRPKTSEGFWVSAYINGKLVQIWCPDENYKENNRVYTTVWGHEKEAFGTLTVSRLKEGVRYVWTEELEADPDLST